MTLSVGAAPATGARQALTALQQHRLARMLAAIHGRSAFYTRKFAAAGIDIGSLSLPEDLARLPLTTRAELVADQEAHQPWGSTHSEPLPRYTRYSQTSSTSGRPLRWIDTPESWQTLVDCWTEVFRAARVEPDDRILFPFSFGPFAGFWIGFESACRFGAHCIPAGGLTSEQRLSLIDQLGVTVVCCTPTYALRLAEVAASGGRRPLTGNSVRTLIVGGEPGGSIPGTRERIAECWGARVIDHYGVTEAGSISVECWEAPGGTHVIETEFISEVIDPVSLRPVADGEVGELVITNLRRTANPAIRYRTGDLVRRSAAPCPCGRSWSRLVGGILGRADDMVSVRGVNIYPSAVEAVVRRFSSIVEFRSTVASDGTMRSLTLEIEVSAATPAGEVIAALGRDLRDALGLTVPITVVPAGTLPRFESKARRMVVAS